MLVESSASAAMAPGGIVRLTEVMRAASRRNRKPPADEQALVTVVADAQRLFRRLAPVETSAVDAARRPVVERAHSRTSSASPSSAEDARLWRTVARMARFVEVTERLADTMRRLGEPARAALYEQRAEVARGRVARFTLLLETIDLARISARAIQAELAHVKPADDSRVYLPLDGQVKRGSRTALKRGSYSVGYHFQLTPREREVAVLVARGYSNEQIASELVITPGTTKNHVGHVLAKYGYHSRRQVMAALLSVVGGLREDELAGD